MTRRSSFLKIDISTTVPSPNLDQSIHRPSAQATKLTVSASSSQRTNRLTSSCSAAKQQLNKHQDRAAMRKFVESTMDPKTGRYHCPKCSEHSFSQSYSMYRHFRYECKDVPPRYQCPYCDNVSKWTHTIYNHVRKFHPGLAVHVTKLY